MAVKFANNASSTLASSIADTDTSLTLDDASAFPSLAGDEWFPLTVVNGSGDIEILRVTARSSDTLTVDRGQEGTTAVAFAAGAKCDLRLTAAALADLAPSGGGGGGPGKYVATIGDGVEYEFTITHNLGTQDIIVCFRPNNPVNGSDFEPLVHPDDTSVQWTSFDPATGAYQLAVYESFGSRTDNAIQIECVFFDYSAEETVGTPIPTGALNVSIFG